MLDWNVLSENEKSLLVGRTVYKWEMKWEGESCFVWMKDLEPNQENWIHCSPFVPSENLETAIDAIEVTVGESGSWGLMKGRDIYTISIYEDFVPVVTVSDASIQEGICKAVLLFNGISIAGENPRKRLG